MPTALRPLDAATAAALQQALHDDAQPLAAIDAQGVLQWCNARFAALWAPAVGPPHRLDQWLSADDARRLVAGEPVTWRQPASRTSAISPTSITGHTSTTSPTGATGPPGPTNPANPTSAGDDPADAP